MPTDSVLLAVAVLLGVYAAFVLRLILRNAGPEPVDEHWPGPPEGKRLIKGLAFG